MAEDGTEQPDAVWLDPALQRAANVSCGSRDVSDRHVHPEVESREEERESKQC